MPSRRVFGTGDTALDVDPDAQETQGAGPLGARRPSTRVSFSGLVRKPSILGRWSRAGGGDEESGATQTPERPAIPSALQASGEVYTTPLPILSMAVLSITMLGEFLCANVSAPFLLFMVEGFGQFHDESQVGYWTGLLVSTFFLTQFLTSLLWATVASKHNPRIVLTISLLGSAVTCCLFGTSTSIEQAIATRLMQGVFAGAIGVARGTVASITDQSNEGRAYAILGFCWGFGGVSGAIVGGTFESPAQKWPNVFAKVPLFVTYPYLLPCCVAASITFIGSVLSLFLSPDCGPREGAIQLPPEKLTSIPEESRPSTPHFDETDDRSFYGSLRYKVSGYLAKRSSEQAHDSPGPSQPVEPPMPLVESTSARKLRTFSRVSRTNGSAYGYGSSYRNRLASAASMASRRGSTTLSLRRRRESAFEGAPSSVATGSDMNFAQRLLMANENAVTNIADLWVAAAINADNEDPFEESDSELDAERQESFSDYAHEHAVDDDELEEGDHYGSPSTPRHNRFSRRVSSAAARTPAAHRASSSQLRPSSSARRFSNLRRGSSSLVPGAEADELPLRRPSSGVPPIFSHVGVRTPPAVLEAQQLLAQAEAEEMDALTPIAEQSRRASRGTSPSATSIVAENEPSIMSMLPLAIILQYGWLALHSTTHDQVFYLYLVSKYPSGGLNLNAGHFSQLIALMCLAQIAYQFVLYPNIGPPRGRFSHLSMFRLGSLLFIPSYLTVILYRVFASPSNDGNLVLMAALALSTAVRYCGSTFSYTAISVLLNYMTPPHLVGYANGIAQSIVSLARFAGPILGGTLWSKSVQDGPAGYPLGFIVCSCACALAILHSFWIR
ncbi:major facilitator superfamily MFS-1 [Dichomitus squalens]|uniref:Major facilitator superfamily MFS-1 n=1 Tax=Dichomitus squalens TaxID=114155 RepID=A0A4Q9Q0A2_9APHY|nr:major facilitator superfamily MFS-1 [Dichomitus squalens]TBU60350.1 major facilitator superfamily MFS-1 [Dichomitus squalens]